MTRLGTMTHAGAAVLAGVLTALAMQPLPVFAQNADPQTCESALSGSPVAVDGQSAIGRCCLVDIEIDWYNSQSVAEGGIYSVNGGPPIQALTCSPGDTALATTTSLIDPNLDLTETGTVVKPPPDPDP